MSQDTLDTLREPAATRRDGARSSSGQAVAAREGGRPIPRGDPASSAVTSERPATREEDAAASAAVAREPSPPDASSLTPLRARLPVSSSVALDERQEMIRIISNRLFLALAVLTAVLMTGAALMFNGRAITGGATVWLVLLSGCVGGFIGLQKRLKTLEHEDLALLARSWVYVVLSPLVGGILALLTLILFVSGLLDGDLFPNFVGAEREPGAGNDLSSLTRVYGAEHTDYAKLVFWCFVAGYSERFVTNIVSHFETTAEGVAGRRPRGR